MQPKIITRDHSRSRHYLLFMGFILISTLLIPIVHADESPTPTPTPAYCGYSRCYQVSNTTSYNACVACNSQEYCNALCPAPPHCGYNSCAALNSKAREYGRPGTPDYTSAHNECNACNGAAYCDTLCTTPSSTNRTINATNAFNAYLNSLGLPLDTFDPEARPAIVFGPYDSNPKNSVDTIADTFGAYHFNRSNAQWDTLSRTQQEEIESFIVDRSVYYMSDYNGRVLFTRPEAYLVDDSWSLWELNRFKSEGFRLNGTPKLMISWNGEYGIWVFELERRGPIANFTATPTTGTVTQPVTFTDISDVSPTRWLWDFGDGTNATAQNVTHVYNVSGTYNVTLKAWNDLGSDTISRPYTVNDLPATTTATPLPTATTTTPPLIYSESKWLTENTTVFADNSYYATIHGVDFYRNSFFAIIGNGQYNITDPAYTWTESFVYPSGGLRYTLQQLKVYNCTPSGSDNCTDYWYPPTVRDSNWQWVITDRLDADASTSYGGNSDVGYLENGLGASANHCDGTYYLWYGNVTATYITRNAHTDWIVPTYQNATYLVNLTEIWTDDPEC